MLSPAATMYSARVRISSSRLNLDCFHCIRNSNPLCVYVPEKLLEILDTLSFTKTRRLSDVVGNLIKGLHPTCSCSRLSEHINLVAPRGRGAVWRLSALFFRSPNYLPSNPVKKHSPTEWCRNNSPRRAVALREDGPSCGLWPARKHAADCVPKLGLLAGVDTNEYVPLELLIFERPPLVTQLQAASLTIKYHASRCSLHWSCWDMLYETKSTVPRINI